jgi:phage minor structural protein
MLFILNRKGKTVGILSNEVPQACPYFNDLHTEAIENNLNILEFDIPSSHPSSSLLEVEGSVLYTDMDNKLQLFVIKEITDSHNDSNVKSVYCEHGAVGDLLGCIVRPTTMHSANLEQAVEHVLNTTGWELGTFIYSGVRDIAFTDYITSLEALHTIVQEFGVEMEFEVIYDGTKVVKKVVNVVEKRGKVTGKLFDYTKDVLEVERTEDTKNLVTALIGVGRGDSDGTLLTLLGFNADQDERFVKIDDYIADMDSFQRFNKDGRHIFGVFKDDKATNQVELFKNTKAKLEELSKPRLTYTVKVVSLERLTGYGHEVVRIGDTIKVRDFSYEPALVLEARVIELKRSKTDPSSDEVTLGDYRPIVLSQDSTIIKLQKVILEKEMQWDSAKKTVEEVKDNIVYKVELSSSNGLIFKNGVISSTISAKVYKGKEDITDKLQDSAFVWQKFDKDGKLDTTWTAAHTGVGSNVVVSSNDISTKATFWCDVDASLLK